MKEVPTVDSLFLGAFPSDCNLKATKKVNVISLFTVAYSVNYTRVFRELVEATK